MAKKSENPTHAAGDLQRAIVFTRSATFKRVAKPLKSMNLYYRNAPAIACAALSSGRRWRRTVAGRREDHIRQRTTELKVVAALFERHYYVAQHGRFSSGIEWPIHSDGGPQQSCSLTAT
jgi:hypothetical protein